MAEVQSLERRVSVLIAAACVIPACLAGAQAYVSARLDGHPVALADLVFSAGDWLLLGPLLPFAFAFARRSPFERRRPIRSTARHLAAALLLALAWAFLGLLLGMALDHFPAVPPLALSYVNWVAITTPFATLIYLAVVGASYAYTFLVVSRERETQLANARLNALRMQLHPHFLFNTLNTALVLVREGDDAGAAQVLELLGELLRALIRTDRPHEIPLREELRFLEQYLAIEQLRFGDRLRVTWSIDERAGDALVPDFVLQPLVENAIRHGFARRTEGSEIILEARVEGRELELRVTDNGRGFETAPADGVGLTNTRQRLQTLYGDRATFHTESEPERGTRAVIRVPFRTHEDV